MIGFVMTHMHVKETNGMYSIQIVVFTTCEMILCSCNDLLIRSRMDKVLT
jgi:hypothetical protein